jgi:hypothetical protein
MLASSPASILNHTRNLTGIPRFRKARNRSNAFDIKSRRACLSRGIPLNALA